MTRRLVDGGYAISDQLYIPGEGTSNFIFGRAWLLEIISLTNGEFHFYSDGREVRPTMSTFGVFYPPFTFVRAFARNVSGTVRGIGSEDLLSKLPTSPFIFETDFHGEFREVDQVFDILNATCSRQSIDINTRPCLVSLRAKKLIDESYLTDLSISRVAGKVNVSHGHLSRQFKKDYGLSPNKYRHRLRVAEATFRLAQGADIIDISQDVGYNDLSRFYKQFRNKYGVPPGRCRAPR